jgi:hypothetical protein
LRIEIEQFSSGWSGLRILMTKQEAKAMRELLLSLEAEEIGHFHASSLDQSVAQPGVADIEFSLLALHEPSNAAL